MSELADCPPITKFPVESRSMVVKLVVPNSPPKSLGYFKSWKQVCYRVISITRRKNKININNYIFPKKNCKIFLT